MKINKSRMVLLGVVLLVAITILMFSLRDVVREVIVIPLSYIFWLIGLLIDSTSQLFFWLGVLFIALLIAWRSIRPKKKAKSEEEYRPLTREESISGVGRGRVSYWLARWNMLRLGTYYQDSFNESLSRLLIDLLSYRHHLSARQVEQALAKGSLNVPPEIADFVRSHSRMQLVANPNILVWLMNSIREWFLMRLKKGPVDSTHTLDPAVVRVIAYMEKELEGTYDQSGS